eukprot:9340199-Alexandrium_andersonii.AAC.1
MMTEGGNTASHHPEASGPQHAEAESAPSAGVRQSSVGRVHQPMGHVRALCRTVNVTSLRPHLSGMLHEMSSPDTPLIVAVQEHAANDASRQSMARVASAAKCDLLLGPHSGPQDSPSAGVGFLAKKVASMRKVTFLAPAIHEFHKLGRVEACVFCVGLPCPVLAYS